MDHHASIKYILSLFIIALLISACGGGGGESSTSSGLRTGTVNATSSLLLEEVTGQFIDGPVAGLSYMCSSVDSKSGITNVNGEFTCYEGNTVTFKVGSVLLGSNLVTSIITPVSLHPNEPQAALNVARLLQSLDDDGDLETIQIDNSEVKGLDASLDVKSDSFEVKANRMLTRGLVSKADAIAHLNGNLRTFSSDTISSDGMAFVEHTPTNVVSDRLTVASLINLSPVITEDTDVNNDTGSSQSGSISTTDLSETSVTGYVDMTDSGYSNEDIVPVCKQGGDATQEGKVTDQTGKALSGVTVNIGGCEETTGSDGTYKFQNIVTDDKAIVNFKKDGFFPNSTIIAIKKYSTGTTSISPNHLEFALDSYDNVWKDDEDYNMNGTHIEIAPGSYTDIEGKKYIGMIEFGLAYEDSSSAKTRDTLPGALQGRSSEGDIIPFIVYRFMVITAKDKNGNELGIMNDATLKFPNVTETTIQTIPLWYYDYIQGLWLEEGYATRQPDGSYRGSVSHLGTWSLSMPVENTLGIYRGRIVDENGIHVKDARVFAIGDNWRSTDLTTDSNGIFELYVVPDSRFVLKAYDYKNQHKAIYNGILPGVSSGETVQNRM